MTELEQKIQKSSKGVYIAMNVLKCFLILGLAMLVLVSIWYADAYSLGRAEAQTAFGDILKKCMPVVPAAPQLMPQFFVCLALQVAYSGVTIVGLGQAAKLFRDISREGEPFAERRIHQIRKMAKMIVIVFVIGTIKAGLESALKAGNLGFYLDIDLTWLVALLLMECLLYIFEYACQLQRESDETL